MLNNEYWYIDILRLTLKSLIHQWRVKVFFLV